MNSLPLGSHPRRRGIARPVLLAPLLLAAACADLGSGLRPPAQAAADPTAVSVLNRMNPNPCTPAVASSLAGAGVPLSDVRELTYGLYRDQHRGRIVEYDAWAALNSQPGAVVVKLDEDCTPRVIYARGGARLPR